MATVVFDGVVLSDMYTVLVRRGLSYHEVAYENIPGRDGVAVTSSDLVPPELSLVFVIGPSEDPTAAVRELSAILDVREPRELRIGEDGGLSYMALPSGSRTWRRVGSSSSVEVPFLIVDAAMHGDERSATVPSGGSVTFSVGGTYPTRPKIEATAAVRNSSSGQWGIRLDGGDYIRFEFGSNTSRTVVADCQARTAKVAGATAIPTLQSDWLELTPGEHTLQMDQGTGAATVTWRERWHA